jgi:hypothetical protein
MHAISEDSVYISNRLNTMGEWIAQLLRIQTGLEFKSRPRDRLFSLRYVMVFVSIQANAATVPSIKSQPPHSPVPPVHYLVLVLSFNDTIRATEGVVT